MSKEYQFEYSKAGVANEKMFDAEGRQLKALKLTRILEDSEGGLSNLKCLEVSCSAGYMTRHFGECFDQVVAIDIDEHSIPFAKQNNNHGNVEYVLMDALNMALPANSFDVVICNQVYEHVSNPDEMMSEIYRVLKPGGVCLFGATNRLKVVETHYGRIPFLSWLPKPLSHLYLRLLGKGSFYYETLLTVWSLRRLTRKFQLSDYTIKVIKYPDQFSAQDMVESGSLKQKLVLLILRLFYFISPGYLWVLRK